MTAAQPAIAVDTDIDIDTDADTEHRSQAQPLPGSDQKPVVQPGHAASAAQAHHSTRINIWRYWRIVAFFLSLFLQVIGWEVVLRRIMGARYVLRGRSMRTRRMAHRFRNLAIRLGGVMIKLGQFLSSRVDVLPPEITDELAGLQDQVPIVSFDYIQATVERELGPLVERFLWFNAEPVAAASFGQVHRAQLPTGERVVVKVQRPNISEIVNTDLSALSAVSRIMMWWPLISRRANVPALLDEFSRVLWEELDYVAEADHAMTFASMFADDQGVYVPAVYLSHSTAYVLTLEDVTSIKVNDYAALEKAGVNRKTIASRLLDTYLRQIFDYRFFHADPHPGNIFIYPIPDKYLDGQLEAVRSGKAERPFYLVFIDFGMVGRLTPAIYEGLRETIIAVATRDPVSLVNAYQKLGVLLPGADTKRIEEATRVVFDKVWGLNMQQLQNLSYDEMLDVGKQFSDLLMTMPFQMPQDFIYLSRAVGILSGMCTGLDPQFDPWAEMQPFTSKLLSASTERTQSALGTNAAVSGVRSAAGLALNIGRSYVMKLIQLPTLAETVLARADRGELNVQVTLDAETRQQITQMESAWSQILISVVFATLSLSSTLLYINNDHTLGLLGYGLAFLSLLLIAFRRRG